MNLKYIKHMNGFDEPLQYTHIWLFGIYDEHVYRKARQISYTSCRQETDTDKQKVRRETITYIRSGYMMMMGWWFYDVWLWLGWADGFEAPNMHISYVHGIIMKLYVLNVGCCIVSKGFK